MIDDINYKQSKSITLNTSSLHGEMHRHNMTKLKKSDPSIIKKFHTVDQKRWDEILLTKKLYEISTT